MANSGRPPTVPVDLLTPAPPARSPAEPGTDAAPDRSRWVLFGVVSIALFMASIDSTIVATALSTLHRSLHAPLNWTGWTITAYQLGFALTMPIAGRISDQYGRKKIFIGCVASFTVASLLCGLSTSIYMLVGLRFVQALGGGGIIPSATGIVADRFGADRDRAIGMFSSIFPLGGILGPVLGGVIISAWSWRVVFLINVPIGLLLIPLLVRVVPRSSPRPGAHADVPGALLLGLTIFGAMLGITDLGNAHTRPLDPSVIIPLLIAVGAGVVFVHRAGTQAVPIIPLKLLRGRVFGAVNFLNVIFGAAALGFASLIPVYAQTRYHLSTLASGTLLSFRAVGMISVAAATSFLLRRIGYRLPIVVGFTLIVFGMFAAAIQPPVFSVEVWLALSAALTGLGFGMAAPASNNASLSLAPDDIAAITGLRGLFRQLGGIMAISITTAALARSTNQGLSYAHAFFALCIIVIVTLPLVRLVPDPNRRRRHSSTVITEPSN